MPVLWMMLPQYGEMGPHPPPAIVQEEEQAWLNELDVKGASTKSNLDTKVELISSQTGTSSKNRCLGSKSTRLPQYRDQSRKYLPPSHVCRPVDPQYLDLVPPQEILLSRGYKSGLDLLYLQHRRRLRHRNVLGLPLGPQCMLALPLFPGTPCRFDPSLPLVTPSLLASALPLKPFARLFLHRHPLHPQFQLLSQDLANSSSTCRNLSPSPNSRCTSTLI
jgi:hypothetical protein